ncbi:unnamed protein product [Rhodiola kirilowii]
MNSTTNSSSFFGSYTVSGISYGIGISIGILMLIITITIASYFCAKTATRNMSINGSDQGLRQPEAHEIMLEMGIDDEIIETYPKLLYSEAQSKGKGLSTTSTCCSICLADYKGSDVLRMLPECNHFFHVKCVHPWLRLHPTCPVCRTSPLPSPLSTPLAEVVPLASRRD